MWFLLFNGTPCEAYANYPESYYTVVLVAVLVLIDYFWITFGLFFKASPGASSFGMKISFHLHVNEN